MILMNPIPPVYGLSDREILITPSWLVGMLLIVHGIKMPKTSFQLACTSSNTDWEFILFTNLNMFTYCEKPKHETAFIV